MLLFEQYLRFFNLVVIGTILEFILAPISLLPISSWIIYAKSIVVAPFGSTFISPFGVNTYTSSSKNSVFKASINCSGSFVCSCHSIVSLIHASLSSVTDTTAFFSLIVCFLICPVCCNTKFCNSMHFFCPYLNFKRWFFW